MNSSNWNNVYENVTLNSTSFPKNENDQLSAPDWVGIFLYALVFLLGVPGNGLVVWITAFDIKRSVNTIWFLNLAVADLLCCLSVPINITTITLRYWPLGLFCKVILSIVSITMYTSILLLTVISIDRCVLVIKPVWCQNKRTLGKAYVACAVIWILAIVFNSPSFIFWGIRKSEGKEECKYDYEIRGEGKQRTENFITISRLLIGFILPFLVLVTCYTILIIRVRNRFTKTTKIMKVVLVVITGFFICWLPYHVFGMIAALSPNNSWLLTHKSTIEIFIAIAFMNNCINPIIYVLMGQDLKSKMTKSISTVLRNALVEEASQSRDTRKKKSTVGYRNSETSV